MRLPWQIRCFGLHAPRFMLYGVGQAVRHPMTPIRYHFCPDCKVSLPSNRPECPICGGKVAGNPRAKLQSPVPWWGSVVIIGMGIVCWCIGGGLNIDGLAEAGRALVYIPLGSLFGLSLPR